MSDASENKLSGLIAGRKAQLYKLLPELSAGERVMTVEKFLSKVKRLARQHDCQEQLGPLLEEVLFDSRYRGDFNHWCQWIDKLVKTDCEEGGRNICGSEAVHGYTGTLATNVRLAWPPAFLRQIH